MNAMARSHFARPSAWARQASRTAKRLVWPLRATLAAAAALALAGSPLLSGQAAAQPRGLVVTRGSAAEQRPPLELKVTSLSPSFAEPGHTITITGKITNTTSLPVSDLNVAVLASGTSFGSRGAVEAFAHGKTQTAGLPAVTSVAPVTKTQLDARHSWTFRLRLPVSALGFSCFGVYPLAIQVTDSALETNAEPVPLPYWPSRSAGSGCAQRPKRFPVSWVWPLIDAPHQGVCKGLTDNKLVTTLGPRGRLGYLLAVGQRYASAAQLTWAVDPALLDSAKAMSGPHDVGFQKNCRDPRFLPPSENARRWLATLAKATAGRPLFATPYADVDVAALARMSGDNADLGRAIATGNSAVAKVLGRSPVPAAGQADGKQLSAIAWPPGGRASASLQDILRGKEGIHTLILTAPVPPATFTPGAVTRMLPGIGKYLNVLLADRNITTLLASREAASPSSGDIFRVSQLYLAQTAMIVAEQPAAVRPIMVAPPRRWNPPRRLASGLLADTVAAPWLTPVTASKLATMPPGHVYKHLTSGVSTGEISGRLLAQLDKLQARTALLQSVHVTPDPNLYRAVFGIESSAWRGSAGSKHAWRLLAHTESYVRSQLHGLYIRGSGGRHSVLHVTFGGRSSSVPVAVFNNLHYWVRVKLIVHASSGTVIGQPSQAITIPPQNFSRPVKITLRTANNRRARITLSLATPNGHRLPAPPLTVVVHTTDLGIIALAIGSAGLALFVIASAMRAIRSGRPARVATEPGAHADPGSEPGSPGHAEFDEQGLVHPGRRPEHIDSVGANGSGLVSAGPELADQETATGRGKNGDHL